MPQLRLDGRDADHRGKARTGETSPEAGRVEQGRNDNEVLGRREGEEDECEKGNLRGKEGGRGNGGRGQVRAVRFA